MLQAEYFFRGPTPIPKLVMPSPTKSTAGGNANARQQGAGLFSTLTNFLSLSSPNSADDVEDGEPTPEEVESESLVLECVRACRVKDLVDDSRFLEDDALKHLVKTIIQSSFEPEPSRKTKSMGGPGATKDLQRSSRPTTPQSLQQEDSSPSEQQRQQQQPPSPPPPSSPAPQQQQQQPPARHNPAAVLMVELVVNIAIQNRDRVAVVWPVTFEYLSGILKGSGQGQYPAVLVERAVVGLLRLIIRLAHKEDMTTQVFQSLDLLASLPPDTLTTIAEQLMAGLLLLIQTDPTVVTRHARWETLLALLSSTSMHPDAARYGFKAACLIVSDKEESAITAENFGECVDLVIGFAAAAGGM
ncbi:GDP/GTP exchange factor for ARF, partial [Borealophlyctis nickersoniae]